jgi:hypothetical protein
MNMSFADTAKYDSFQKEICDYSSSSFAYEVKSQLLTRKPSSDAYFIPCQLRRASYGKYVITEPNMALPYNDSTSLTGTP